MKKTAATVLLIIFNALGFYAGICAAINSAAGMQSFGPFLLLCAIYLVAVPAPLAFVWGTFRDVYGFSRLNFYLCTLLPPFILSTAANIIMFIFAVTVGSQNGGYGGLAMIGLIMANSAATVVLLVDIVLWTTLCELAKSDLAKKVWAIILLGVCGTIICSELSGLLDFPFSGFVTVVYTDSREDIISYSLGILRACAVLALPLGFGVAKLMRIYREEYSLKPPLFILLAFLPALLIAGGLMAARYSKYPDLDYYLFKLTDQLETIIFTAAVAVVSAIIYAVAALIRRKRKAIDTP